MSNLIPIVNPWHPCTFIPKIRPVNIVFHDTNNNSLKRCLQPVAAHALERMVQAALTEQCHIIGISGYRSIHRQQEIYYHSLCNKGTTHTRSYIALPGYSEHHTGLAMDVSSPLCHYELENTFEQTPEFHWLTKNAYSYGFILRYPKYKESITGYQYEPWHYRYVGIPLARLLYTQNLTLEEYYFVTFT